MNIRIMRCRNDLYYCKIGRGSNNEKELKKVPIIGFTIEISEEFNNAYAKPILINGDVILDVVWTVYDAKTYQWYTNLGDQGSGLHNLGCFLMSE